MPSSPLRLLFRHPLVSIRFVEKRLGVTFVTAGNLVERLQAEGLLVEITGRKRNRWFRYEPYIRLFEKQVPKVGQGRGQRHPVTASRPRGAFLGQATTPGGHERGNPRG